MKNLEERINDDFITAMKSRDAKKKTLLGVIKGEIQNEKGRGVEITDDVVVNILRKMEKSLLITNTEESLAELEFIKNYLPALMSEEQISEIIRNYKANGLTNIGQIMGEFNKNFKGLADNKLVSKIANQTLSE
jgi:uncharacterized protein YqeY